MTSESEFYERLQSIFDEARALSGAARESVLDARCDADAELRKQVEDLLAAVEDDDESDLLSESSVAIARSALQPGDTGWLPERIGRYTIVRRIGEGGMGVIYEARQESPRRSVAIKLLHPLYATPDRVRRFQQEAELLGRLRHPGIAQIHEAGLYDVGRGTQPFFAMELIEGVDVRTHCEREKLGVRAKLELIARICDAVQFAHDRGVIHRDLKPDNVLVDGHGQPKVLDFGIARAAKTSTILTTIVTEEGQLVGTLGYMAPEQLHGVTEDVSGTADVYALGVLAFELLTRRLPHHVADLPVSAAVHLLANTDAPPAGTIDSALKGDVETIVGKALESTRERRYASPAALADDIRRHLDELPIRARRPSRLYRIRKFTRRNRGLTIGAVATFGALSLGLITALVLMDREREQRMRADANALEARRGVARIVATVHASTREALRGGNLWGSYESQQLVPDAHRGWSWRLRNLAVPGFLPVPSDLISSTGEKPPGPRGPRWRFFDDSTIFGVHGAADAILVYDVVEDAQRELFSGLGLETIGPANASGFAVGRRPGESVVLDLQSETVLARYPSSGDAPPGNVSDDGRVVVVHYSPSTARAYVDGVLRHAPNYSGPTNHPALNPHCHVTPDGTRLFVNRLRELLVIDVETGAERTHRPAERFDLIAARGYDGGWITHQLGHTNKKPHQTKWQTESEPSLDDGVDNSAIHGGSWFAAPRDGRFVAVGTDRGATLFDPRTSRPVVLCPEQAGSDFVRADTAYWAIPEVSPSGDRMVLLTLDRPPLLIEFDERRLKSGFDPRCETYREHGDFLYHVAVSPDGSMAATASPVETKVRVWDTRTLETLTTLERATHDPASRDAYLAFAPSGDHLVMTTPMPGRAGAGVVSWNLLTGETSLDWPDEPLELGNHATLLDAFVRRLDPGPRQRLSRKAQMLGATARTVWQRYELWHWQNAPTDVGGERWRVMPEPGRDARADAWALALHPTEDVVAVGSSARVADGATFRDALLSLRRASDGSLITEVELPDHPWAVAWSPDASTIAVACGHGGRIVFVETEFFTLIDEIDAHAEYVKSLVWTPDGERLITVSGDKTARVFDARRPGVRNADLARWRAARLAAAEALDRGDEPTSSTALERPAIRVERIRRAPR